MRGAKLACNAFGSEWTVKKEVEGALICTKNGLSWKWNCNPCRNWRLVVWMDGSNEHGKNSFSTREGHVYGGHYPCGSVHTQDNFSLCGKWGMAGMNCMIRISGWRWDLYVNVQK